MKQGVILCGLNGSGKSTLGRALAQRLGWEFLDIEDCFFPRQTPAAFTPTHAPPRRPRPFWWSAPPLRKALCWPA